MGRDTDTRCAYDVGPAIHEVVGLAERRDVSRPLLSLARRGFYVNYRAYPTPGAGSMGFPG